MGPHMGPIWGLQDPGGPHVGPMYFAIWLFIHETNISHSEFYVYHFTFPLPPYCRLNSLWSVTPYAVVDLGQNGSGNCLLPDGNKPLPEFMLTSHQWGILAFTGGPWHMISIRDLNAWFVIITTSSSGGLVNINWQTHKHHKMWQVGYVWAGGYSGAKPLIER